MADIVNIDSLGLDEIRADIEKYLSIVGELDLTTFNESSTMRKITSVVAALYTQIKLELDSNQRESIMHSAIKPESIKYIAQSQLAYHPKRKIAPQHPLNTCFKFKLAIGGGSLYKYAVLGLLSIGDKSYPISIIDAKAAEIEELSDGSKIVKCRLGIGSWREVTIAIEENLGHLEPFHVFQISEEKDIIDDSNTIHISLVGTEIDKEPEVIDNLYDINSLRSSEKQYKVLVTSNYYGGLDINFGDGMVFGNILYNESMASDKESRNLNKFTIWYFVTPGFIPNLAFTQENISWDTNYVDETYFENSDNFNFRMANGIDEETLDKIKTLAPYVSMSNNRILTNDDFISRVRRIPQIKSCASRPRHIEPKSLDEDSETNELLIPTATFELTGLTYRANSEIIEIDTWAKPPLFEGEVTGYRDYPSGTVIKWGAKTIIQNDNEEVEVPRYWLLSARVFQPKDKNDAAIYMYDSEGSGIFEERALYAEDDKIVQVWYEKPPEQSIYYVHTINQDVDGNEIIEKIPVNIWEELDEENLDLYVKMAYQPLTQMEWDLNFHAQYNFDILLGFMRVRILPPIEEMVNFDLTIVLKQNLDVNARSQFEIDQLITQIINSYCWNLGVFLDVGKIVADILKVSEVSQCYLHSPIANKQYAIMQYIKPEIKISYQDVSNVGNQYHK